MIVQYTGRPLEARPSRLATSLLPACALAAALAGSTGVAHAQDGASDTPGDIVRDCAVEDRLSILWRPANDDRARRYDVFSRPTTPGAPADWHGWTAFDGEPRYTFEDRALEGREFRIALKDGSGGEVRSWSTWQLPACAGDSASAGQATQASDTSGGDRCGSDGSTRLSWDQVPGARQYDLFRSDPNGSAWLRSVPGDQPRTNFAPGSIGESDRIQVDVLLGDGSRRYGHAFANGCGTASTAGAVQTASAPATLTRDIGADSSRGGQLPASLPGGPSGWTRHPWSHDFDVASDLDRWHAPHRLGGRDPDDRHIGRFRKERAGGPLTDNRAAFAEVARVDTASGHLIMRSRFSTDEEYNSGGLGQGEAQMPFLVSAAAFDVLDPADGRRLDWTKRYPYDCVGADGQTISTPCDFVVDPRDKDHYIEIRASFEGAKDAFKTWWAFWLYPRNRAYDGNVDTGMEVDVLEYVPYVSPDGFHAALFRKRGETLRPEGRAFAARNTDAFLRRTNSDDDACRRNDTCPAIRLDEGFHTIGIAYSRSRYAFYLDGYRFWEVTDPNWITKEQHLALRLTWEKDEGIVIDDKNGNGVLDYLDDGAAGGPRDGIPDWLQSPKRTSLSYGPWGQGFATSVMYDSDCLVTVVDGRRRDQFAGQQFTFDVARGRYGIAASDLQIVDGSCALRRYTTSHPPSEVRVDYVHVYTRDR